MTSVGFATLDVIPSLKGAASSIEKQAASQFAQAGKVSGAKFGSAAGSSAATGFGKAKGKFLSEAKAMAAPLAGIFAGAAVVNFFGDAIDEAREAAKVHRATAQLIETTGKSANLTAEQVGALTTRMMDYAAVDDDVIQAGANVLLTFKNVANQVGEGNQIFDRATKAGLDLQAVLGGDLAGSAKLLGKALNDPIKGITALTRAGVQFTEDQQNQIKALVASNDLLGAQKIVLGEVEGQVGGTAGASVDATQRMQVAFGELKESVGGAVLPALEEFSDFMVKDGIPALEATGGAVSDAVGFFNDLPGPVKAATGALVALKAASALGIGTSLSAGAARAGSALDTLRLKSMLAADEYRNLRGASIQAENAGFKFNGGSGRIVSGLGAVKSAASGAGSALKRGLGGALGLVGGPWALAFIAGTAVLTHFWQENQKSKQRVEELTDSLNKQTGAITKQTKELAFKNLEESGAIDRARELGVNLKDLTDASLGNADAQKRVNAQLAASKSAFIDSADAGRTAAAAGSEFENKADKVRSAIGGQNDELNDSIQNFKDHSSAMGDSAGEQENLTGKVRDYDKALKHAKDALNDLIDAEQTRADNAVRNRRDQLGLITTIKDAEKEARKGKETLDENTSAGRKNLGALLDLADQWNNSSPKVQNARGAYQNLRGEFIKLADQMNGPNGTRKDAILLADSLLKIPKNTPIKFQSTGFKERMAEIAALKAAAAGFTVTDDLLPAGHGLSGQHPNSGGGDDKPGGDRSAPSSRGVTITIGKVEAQNVNTLLTDLQRRAHRASSDGIR